MSAYVRRRRKMALNLADDCHDKAAEAHSMQIAAEWIALMDALLWLADDEGEIDCVTRLIKLAKTAGDQS